MFQKISLNFLGIDLKSPINDIISFKNEMLVDSLIVASIRAVLVSMVTTSNSALPSFYWGSSLWNFLSTVAYLLDPSGQFDSDKSFPESGLAIT